MKAGSRAILLLNSLALGLMIPILSLMLLEKGCTLSELALLLGIYSLSVFSAEIPSGILADLFGRKRIFILSCFFYIGSAALLLFLKGWWVIAGIIPWGIGKALSTGSFDALAIDTYIAAHGTGKLASVTSELALLETAGIAAGSVLGGLLPVLSKSIAPAWGIYDLNLIAKSLLCGIAALLSVVCLKEAPGAEVMERQTLKGHIKESVRFIKENSIVRLLVLGVFFGGFFISTVETYWQPAFARLIDENMIWLLGIMSFSCFAFASIGNVAVKKAMSRFPDHWIMVYNAARAFLSICLAVLSLQSTGPGFGICFSILYFLFGSANVAENTLLNREMPCDKRASMLSFVSFAFQGGALAAPVFSSSVVYYQGISPLWLYTGALLLTVSFWIGFSLRKRRRVCAKEPVMDK